MIRPVALRRCSQASALSGVLPLGGSFVGKVTLLGTVVGATAARTLVVVAFPSTSVFSLPIAAEDLAVRVEDLFPLTSAPCVGLPIKEDLGAA